MRRVVEGLSIACVASVITWALNSPGAAQEVSLSIWAGLCGWASSAQAWAWGVSAVIGVALVGRLFYVAVRRERWPNGLAFPTVGSVLALQLVATSAGAFGLSTMARSQNPSGLLLVGGALLVAVVALRETGRLVRASAVYG